MTIALDSLGNTFTQIAATHAIDPALPHRVAVMASGMLDGTPHIGAVVALLGVCGTTHREAYGGILMSVVVGPVVAVLAVLVLGSIFRSFGFFRGAAMR